MTTLERSPLYTAQATRAIDAATIAAGTPGIALMHRAARALLTVMIQRYMDAQPWHIVCGKGNNGGDGFLLAALAHDKGIDTRLWLTEATAELDGDAALAFDRAKASGCEIKPWPNGQTPLTEGCIVDALLGTGLSGEVREKTATIIHAINKANLPVLAVDIPSGLCSDTGVILGSAVHADTTVTFIGRKIGLYTGAAYDVCGELVFDDLQVESNSFGDIPPIASLLALSAEPLFRRSAAHHKGDSGRVLIVGGDCGYGGAALMAAQASARCGAGLTAVATRPENCAAIVTRQPEVMAHGVNKGHDVLALAEQADVIVCGPGLGQSAWSIALLHTVMATGKPLILDADALNLIAGRGHYRHNWVLTPHPGEAARMLACDTATLQRDRPKSAQQLAKEYGGYVVLKGSGTLIASNNSLAACPYGNPGMGSGGMGDVLSGVIGALVAQGLSLSDAAEIGTCLHSRAADLAAAEHGEVGLLATDLLPLLRGQINGR